MQMVEEEGVIPLNSYERILQKEAKSTKHAHSVAAHHHHHSQHHSKERKIKKEILDGGTGGNSIQASNTHNSSLSKIYSYENQTAGTVG